MAKTAQPSLPSHDRDNPWVVVSTRKFCHEVPLEVFGIHRPSHGAKKPTARLFTNIGPAFLSASVTSWSFAAWRTEGGEPPQAMADANRRPIEIRCDCNELKTSARFRDGDKRNHAAVEAVMLDAFRHLGWGRGPRDDGDITGSRFVNARGQVVPDIVLIRARDIFEESPDARAARTILERVIPYAKDADNGSGLHLGALHDFAVMAGYMGRTISDKCRARGRLFGVL